MHIRKIYILLLVSSFVFTVFIGKANAAKPDFLITWKAENYAPAWYLGKILPIRNSSVIVSFELLSQNKNDLNKVVNLSSSEVRWYINGKFYSSGMGQRSIKLTNKDFSGTTIDIKIMADYVDRECPEGKDGICTYFAQSNTSIPIVDPEISIENKIFGNYLSKGSELNLKAIPFFFNGNLGNLSVGWQVNEKTPEINQENPFSFKLIVGDNIPVSGINIGATVSNIINQTEKASKKVFYQVNQ